MRIDKFLKVSRIMKRRTVANEACDGGRVSINGQAGEGRHRGEAGRCGGSLFCRKQDEV